MPIAKDRIFATIEKNDKLGEARLLSTLTNKPVIEIVINDAWNMYVYYTPSDGSYHVYLEKTEISSYKDYSIATDANLDVVLSLIETFDLSRYE